MIRDYKAAWSEYAPRYEVRFFDHPDGGFAFNCDKDGNVNEAKLSEAALRNYRFAMSNPDKFPFGWNEVEKINDYIRHPATGKCACGKTIELINVYMGACDCPHCGRWYNVFGDELKDPRTWKNGDDW